MELLEAMGLLHVAFVLKMFQSNCGTHISKHDDPKKEKKEKNGLQTQRSTKIKLSFWKINVERSMEITLNMTVEISHLNW